MRLAIYALAASGIAMSACATAETTSQSVDDSGERHVEMRVLHDSSDTNGHKMIKLHIERDGEDPIHVEGDPNSPEVRAALAELGSGFVMDGDTLIEFDSEGQGDHSVWVMKSDDAGEAHKTIEIKKDGKSPHVIVIKDKDVVETIGAEGKGKYEVIIKKETTDAADADHVEKKVIVVKGDSEEEVRAKLKELGLDVDFDVLHEMDEHEHMKDE